MTNSEIVKLLRQVAAAYIVTDENRFRIIAYEKAADAIEGATTQMNDLWKEGKLQEVDGIGKTIAGHLDELFRTGKVKHWENILSDLPAGMFPLLEVPGFGPKKAFKLSTHFRLTDAKTAAEKLLAIAKEGEIAPLEGFGEKSQSDIIEAIGRYQKGQIKENRTPLAQAQSIADDVIEYLEKSKEVQKTVPLGSLRRRLSTIGDIDLAVATKKPKEVLDHFLAYPRRIKTIEIGPTGASIITSSGKQVDLRVQEKETFGSMLQYFTGSKNHNIRLREFALKLGLSLNEYGMKTINKKQITNNIKRYFNSKRKMYEYAKEEDFYNALGLQWVPPELREDFGEVEAAIAHKLPKLIELKDVRGDLHLHTDYPLEPSHDSGQSSIVELMEYASKKGYEYIGLSDHNPSIGNHKLDEIVSIMKRRKSYIEQISTSKKSTRVHLLTMMETDILPDGSLALPNEAFEYIDASIVSIHSSFKMDKKAMTDRILKGLSHPKAKILAHPTGRLIGSREGYEVDWKRIFEFCAKNNKALEINAYPLRLDTPDNVVREAIQKGIKFVIDTDAHEKTQMDYMPYGVSVARRGWAQKSDILNCLGYNDFRNWLLH